MGRGINLGVAAILLCVALTIVGPQSGQADDRDAVWAGIEPVEVASGQARRGPWRMNQSDFDYIDDATVAIAEDGRIGVAWADLARHNIYLQTYTADGQTRFGEPVNVSSHSGIFSWLPRLAISGGNGQLVFALWQEIVFSGGSHGGEIFFARSADGGATFAAPVNLSNTTAGAGKGRLTAERWDNGSLDLAVAPDGHVYAAWTEYEGRLWLRRSIDAGTSFREAVHVAGDDERPARAPALEVDGDGNVHLAWTIGEDAAANIHVATSVDGGRSFGEPLIVASRGHADAPKLATDSEGSLHLVYSESPGGPFQQYRIRYARRDPGENRFSAPRTIAAPQADLDSVNFPDLAIGAADRLHVVWERFPDRRSRAQGLGFTRSDDRGHSFDDPDIVPGSDDPELGFNGGLQGSLMTRLAANGDGALALVTSTFAPGRSSHVWLWHRSAAEP